MTADTPLEDPVAEGDRVVDAATERDLTVRKIGGTAIYDRSETAREEPFARSYRDVDFVGHRSEESDIESLMADLGYEPNERFNTMRPHRLEYLDPEHDRKADFILDRFRFSHAWSLADRLAVHDRTVPIEDLLLSKLQIAEVSDRDIRDSLAILAEYPVREDAGTDAIDPSYVADLCRNDWGLWKTLSINIEKVREYLREESLPIDQDAVEDRLATLETAIDEVPKTLRWKLRSLLGERKRWYRRPELE
ncbi:MAG: hypothetical protein ABEJ84_03315 [Halodesulfurarchaeum sp.]